MCIRLYYHNGDGSGDAASDWSRLAHSGCIIVQLSRRWSSGAEQARPWRAVAASAGAWGSGEEQRGGLRSSTLPTTSICHLSTGFGLWPNTIQVEILVDFLPTFASSVQSN